MIALLSFAFITGMKHESSHPNPVSYDSNGNIIYLIYPHDEIYPVPTITGMLTVNKAEYNGLWQLC